ncbi:MAG: hypothetical protein LBF59_05410 [Prevotellaceae bacterium]|jgi:hypothetical protein|nr:hypothetical protein [Prevotellaceae bacterium]
MSYRNRLTGGGFKPVYAADIGNELVVNDTFKKAVINCQVWIQEMNASELSKKRRNLARRCQNRGMATIPG